MARVVVMPKPGRPLVYLRPRYYEALKRLEEQNGIPVEEAVHRAIKEFVNYYGVHVKRDP